MNDAEMGYERAGYEIVRKPASARFTFETPGRKGAV